MLKDTTLDCTLRLLQKIKNKNWTYSVDWKIEKTENKIIGAAVNLFLKTLCVTYWTITIQENSIKTRNKKFKFDNFLKIPKLCEEKNKNINFNDA